MHKPLRILHLEDDSDFVALVRDLLEQEGIEAETVATDNRKGFDKALGESQLDLILADYRLPTVTGIEALQLARRQRPEVPFLLVSGSIGEEAAVHALRSGATDYINKQGIERLIPAMRRAIQETRERQQRREAESELSRRERFFRALMENTLDVFAIVNHEGRFRYLSPSVKPVLGFAPHELIGKSAFDYTHPDDVAQLTRALNQVLAAADARAACEMRFMTRDGQWRHLEIVGQNRLHDTEVAGIVVNARDITDRKLAQEHLREQAALLDRAQDSIVVGDLEGRIIYWNRGAERLHGWSANEVIGLNARDFLYKETSWMEAAANAIISSGEWHGEVVKKTKSGGEVTLQTRWSLVRDNQGQPKSILSISTDITEKKRLEAQLLRSQRLEAVGKLAGGIAHDLNNILAPIMVSIALLRERNQEADTQRILAMLEAGAKRGADIVKQILWFSRGLEGKRVLLNPRHILKDTARFVAETFDKSIELQTVVPSDLWPILGDPTHLHQVLLNLCVNSRDAMPQGGQLTLAARNVLVDEAYQSSHPGATPGPCVVLEVTDTGAGIPPEIRERIFEPFFTTKEIGKGTGLGLSTVLSIVRDYGGFIHLESQPGQGTRFLIHIPAQPGEQADRLEGELAALPAGHGETILVVDDEETAAVVLQKTLENFGYRVLTAENGEKAMEVYQANASSIAVLVIDLMMPVMDGPSTIQALRRLSPGLKIIAVSGMDDAAAKGLVARLGVEQFIAKPYTAATILQMLHSLLSAPKSAAPGLPVASA
jgi:PAS domain S-box-containing protein